MKIDEAYVEERHQLLLKGFKMVTEDLIRYKRSKNAPLIVMEDGKIVEKDPFKEPLPEDDDAQAQPGLRD